MFSPFQPTSLRSPEISPAMKVVLGVYSLLHGRLLRPHFGSKARGETLARPGPIAGENFWWPEAALYLIN